MIDDLNLDEVNPEAVDAVAKSGGVLPPGKYHARLDGAKDVTSNQKGTPGTELHFTILAGPFAGQEVKMTLWDTAGTQNRVVLFASRLGLLRVNPQTKKYERVPGRHTFQDVLGAQVVIETENREYEKKGGGKGTVPDVTFGGIWSPDDKAVKDVPKAKPGAPAAGKPKPAYDTSKL